jgi:DNA-binding CsgD family transcriptional regulator
MMEKDNRIVLTDRERKVLALVTRGLTDNEIAQLLCLSVSTVKNAIHSARVKLRAHSRFHAALLAIKIAEVNFLDVHSYDELVEMGKVLSKAAGPELMYRIWRETTGSTEHFTLQESKEPRFRDPELLSLLRQLDGITDEKARKRVKAFIQYTLEEGDEKAKDLKPEN